MGYLNKITLLVNYKYMGFRYNAVTSPLHRRYIAVTSPLLVVTSGTSVFYPRRLAVTQIILLFVAKTPYLQYLARISAS